jgi:hypothetical protein
MPPGKKKRSHQGQELSSDREKSRTKNDFIGYKGMRSHKNSELHVEKKYSMPRTQTGQKKFRPRTAVCIQKKKEPPRKSCLLHNQKLIASAEY